MATLGPQLILVGTPIGNLGDLSPRAIEVLGSVAWVACEDTRRTRALFSAANIPAGGRLRALHEHNEADLIPVVLDTLSSGESVGLVSDAGMPAISDPGQRVVAAVAAAGFAVSVVPGPSSVLGALVVSGFSTERFVVEGFLPRKGTERKERLRNIGEETRTIVILEAPNRLHHTLLELAQSDPTRRVVVVRELTKLYEEIWRGTLAEAAQAFGARESIKGEITIVLDGATPVSLVVDEETIAHAASAALIEHRSTKMAADVVAAELGVSRRVAYEAVLRAQEG